MYTEKRSSFMLSGEHGLLGDEKNVSVLSGTALVVDSSL